jgi:hypothetical protein
VVVSSFTPTGVFTGLLAGTAIGLVLAMLGVSTGGEAVRRWPVAVVLLLRTVVYGAVFLVIPTAMFALVQGPWNLFDTR